ncbi:MAG: YcjX family protein [Hyphomicrobiales bacterium]|nr:YcjX family protein [Hyphomicrobiales bacterium]
MMAALGAYQEALLAARSAAQAAANWWSPRLRVGVTGLTRSGKTIFITALVRALVAGGRLPMFAAQAQGRISAVRLTFQPDDAVARFPYEENLAAMSGPDRRWPDSTRRISELSIEIDYESAASWFRGARRLTLDIVDYPGEWLLDLPLLEQSYAEFSRMSVAAAREPARISLSAEWRAVMAGIDPRGAASDAQATKAADAFRRYLLAARAEPHALSLLPPGRFLMPGDLEGSPALTFAPLELGETAVPRNSLADLMEKRFEAYKNHVALPFFRDHFARLDRQIVLVDLLTPLNAGAGAVADLEAALDHVLAAFRVGRNSLLSTLFAPRIERVLFAATKADLLHHTSHDRLQAILGLLVERAFRRSRERGAKTDVLALSALRSTHEATVREGRSMLAAVIGVPEAGEKIDGEEFDGTAEAAIYPGDLPQDPKAALDAKGGLDLRFVRFRPPLVEKDGLGKMRGARHIRLDRALEFLIGDRLA